MPAQYKLGKGPYGSAFLGTITDLFCSPDVEPLRSSTGQIFGLYLGQFSWTQRITHKWDVPKPGLLNYLGQAGFPMISGQFREPKSHAETLHHGRDIRFTGDPHHLIVAGTGAGKFRDALANMLLFDGSCETSCLIIDPKGEIASVTGPVIDSPGTIDPRTVIPDPWDVCGTGTTSSLTLLDGIRTANPHCQKDARVLADAIIVQRGEDDGHWVETAKNFLTALLLYVGTSSLEEGERHLMRLREIVTLPWADLSDLLGHMTTDKIDSSAFGGAMKRAAQAMLNRDEKERRSILSTIERDTAFLEDASLLRAIRTSSFDINQFVISNKRLHVVIPFDYTKEMKSWLRLTIAAYYNACLRHQVHQSFPSFLKFRHIVIDEFAGLGNLDFITKALAEARGAGIKFHIVIQDFGQLKFLYKENWETFVSNSFIQAFGINDIFTAKYLSDLTGQSTVITETTSTSESTSRTKGTSTSVSNSRTKSFGSSRTDNKSLTQGINSPMGFMMGGVPTRQTSGTEGVSYGTNESSGTTTGETFSRNESESTGYSTSQSFSTTGRPVLTPDEIRRLPNNQQLLFLRGMPAVIASRVSYFVQFREFLSPSRTLKNVYDESARALASAPHAKQLAPLSSANALTPSSRALMNNRLDTSKFQIPFIREYTFKDAALYDYGITAGVGIWAFYNLLFLIIMMLHRNTPFFATGEDLNSLWYQIYTIAGGVIAISPLFFIERYLHTKINQIVGAIAVSSFIFTITYGMYHFSMMTFLLSYNLLVFPVYLAFANVVIFLTLKQMWEAAE